MPKTIMPVSEIPGFLDSVAKDIDGYKGKVKPKEYLRVATLSHLRHLTHLSEVDAQEALDRWIAQG